MTEEWDEELRRLHEWTRTDPEARAMRTKVRADILAALGSIGTAEQRDRFAFEVAGRFEFQPVFKALVVQIMRSQERARSFGRAADAFLAAIEDVNLQDVADQLPHQLDDPPPAITAADYPERLRVELSAVASAARIMGAELDGMRKQRRNSKSQRAADHLEHLYREWCWSFGEPPIASQDAATGKDSRFVEVVRIVLTAAGLDVPTYKTIHTFISDPLRDFGMPPD